MSGERVETYIDLENNYRWVYWSADNVLAVGQPYTDRGRMMADLTRLLRAKYLPADPDWGPEVFIRDDADDQVIVVADEAVEVPR